MEKDKKVTALYCRLSKDDGSNSESLSIRTQKAMLMEYATRNGFGNCQYYVDDGYSGTNSDRPAFQELLDDIREGKVATVITKDQSRLGRNHIETGTYMEIFFPEHGVRYIAINDGYDSNEQSQMDIAPFRNIINEMYAKDTSRKIKSALRTRKKSGKYISSGAPFGYQKDPADHNHLVIDPNTAPVVEYIYSMAEEGLGLHRIAKRLHDEKVLKPCYYKKEMFGRFIDDEKMYDWDSAYISQVLHSPVYAGHIIYEAKPTVSMKSKKRRYIPFEERAIVPNTHEAIIPQDRWENVQRILYSRSSSFMCDKTDYDNIFKGIVRCADCGRTMLVKVEHRRKRNSVLDQTFYCCSTYRKYGAKACDSHNLEARVLHEAVFADIQAHAKAAVSNREALVKKIANQMHLRVSSDRAQHKRDLKQCKARIAEIEDLYIDLQKENLLNEELQEIEIFDKPGLFSNGRLRDEDVPDGLYRYDLRGSDYDPGQPITVEKTVVVNHAASVLMAEELDLGAEGRLELGEEGLNFTGAELTVREFMEEQQQKRNGLIHGDSDHIAVEGHIGTWYAVDETEVGGEKFFLLEHEEHGDMAACVAVNEQGKLVAEDLWNGFDEDFQEAVQKYFSEKWNMPKKEDVVSEIIEKAAPVPDNSAQDYSDVPVYYEPFGYAKENDEVDLYRTSYRLNSECKQAIHEAIADNYDGMYLGDGAVDQVVRQYGMERVGYILANTLHHKSYDGRFSHGNKEWAEQVSTPEHNADRMTFRTDWVVDSHPAILDGFVTMYRDELEAQKRQEQPFVKQFYVVENLQAAPLKIERFGNLDDAMAQYQALPNHYMKALGVEKNPDPLPGSLDVLQCRNGIDTIVEDYKTVPGWDNPYIQNHVVQPLQGALAVQDVELAYELPDAYFHIQTCDDGFDYTLYNKDFTERDGGVLETDGDKPVQEAMTELLAEFGCDAAEGRIMDAAGLREQADTVAEQQAEVLKEKLAAERPAPEETLSFYVAECLEFTFAGEFHDHLTMEEALEAYDKIPSERMNADKCIGFCIEEDGGFVGMYELVVNDKVQRENINSINYFRDDRLVQQAISDMEKLMAARQQSKEQERSNTKKSVLDALRSLKAKKQEQPAQDQPKPQKSKKRGDIEL